MLKFSKKPEMIAGGCSFTDANWQSDIDPHLCHDFPKWPSVLADHLGVTFTNLGRSGIGNIEISNRILDELEQNDNVKYVFALWSSYDRFCTGKYNHVPIAVLFKQIGVKPYTNFFERIERDPEKKRLLNSLYDKLLNQWWSWERAYDDNHRAMYMVQKECERRNIKYIFMQGPDPWAAGAAHNLIEAGMLDVKIWTPRLLYKAMDSIYYDKIREENFIDFPGLVELGGNSVSRHQEFFDKYRFSEKDGHPNKEGHQYIARLFMERYNENY